MQLFPALPEVVRGMFRRPEALAVCPPGGDPRERGMFLNQTANYGLSQWDPTDRILMEDFNTDNSKIDAALVNLAAQAAGFGNCQIYRTTYTGTGTAGENNPNTLSFPNIPVLVMIAGSGAIGFTGSGITYMICIQAGSSDFCYADWEEGGKTVSWYKLNGSGSEQLNANGQTYQVTALLAK